MHRIISTFRFFLRTTFFFMLVACSHDANTFGKPNMTLSSPRVHAAFEKSKTVCFGRFLVDVPQTAEVVWGKALVPLGVDIYADGIDDVLRMEQQFIDKLRSEKAINHNGVPLLISVDNIKEPEGKLVTGYEDFEAINGLKINGYFKWNGGGVIIDSRPLRADQQGTVALIHSIAERLRPLGEAGIPSGAGNCIEHAFLPDMENPRENDLMEHIRVGFRLKEFPDSHFSIYVAPSNPHDPESDSLERQFKRIREDPATPEEMKVLTRIKYFRESARKIHEWHTGYEVLMRTPDEDGSLSHHEFQMKFTGVPRDPYKPYADIQFQTGVADNAAGATKSSLTDEEAIAVWDKITSTIRVRPTGSPGQASTAHVPQFPLGELATTGRFCPQTGWWQASEANVVGDARQHFNAGDRMPHVTLSGIPSFWQRLKGENASYRAATMWKLVEYGDAPPQLASGASLRDPSGDQGESGDRAGKAAPPSHKG